MNPTQADWTAEEDELLISQLSVDKFGRSCHSDKHPWREIAVRMNHLAPSRKINRFFSEGTIASRWRSTLKEQCQGQPTDITPWTEREEGLLLSLVPGQFGGTSAVSRTWPDIAEYMGREARMQGISNRLYQGNVLRNRWFLILKPRLEAEGAERVAKSSAAAELASGPQVAIPWTEDEDNLLMLLLRDRTFEEAVDCINVQAPIYGIRNRHYRKEDLEMRWKGHLKPLLERRIAQLAAAAIAEPALRTIDSQASEDPPEASRTWTKEEDDILLSLILRNFGGHSPEDQLWQEIAEYMNVEVRKLGLTTTSFECDNVRSQWYNVLKPELERDSVAREVAVAVAAATSAAPHAFAASQANFDRQQLLRFDITR